MMKRTIWMVNDDSDDHELIREILQELEFDGDIVFFHTGTDLIKRLEKEKSAPFLIMTDVNLPGINGFDLRESLLKTPDKKFHSVPFIFWSTNASNEQIERAYRLRAHGFFIKEGEYNRWKQLFADIITYWSKSKMPSKKQAYDDPMSIV